MEQRLHAAEAKCTSMQQRLDTDSASMQSTVRSSKRETADAQRDAAATLAA
eukprot:COSAG01_NODE_8635_length_2713_cov_1.084927_2_plen_51_part_00